MVYYGQLGSCQLISINKPCVDEMDINSELRSSMHRNLIETKTDVMTKIIKKQYLLQCCHEYSYYSNIRIIEPE